MRASVKNKLDHREVPGCSSERWHFAADMEPRKSNVSRQGDILGFSPELQKKRAKVHAVIKQLKQKGMQATCLYPAQLKLKMDLGERIFPTQTSAADTQRELWIQVQCGEKEHIEEQ